MSSGRSSPVDLGGSSNGFYRTRSGSNNNNGPPRLLGRSSVPNAHTPNDAYDFSMAPSVGGSGTRKRTASQPSMLDAVFPGRSKSPLANSMFSHHGRAASPGASSTGRVASPNRPNEPHVLVSEKGTVIDLDTAYARLNDDALAKSGGALAKLPERRPVTDKQGDVVKAGTGESLTRDGGVRLQKDLESDERAIVDSTDDESSEEEDSGGSYSDEENRGRSGERVARKAPSLIELASEPSSRGNSTDRESNVGVDPGGGKKKKKGKKAAQKGTPAGKKSFSLLAAAEEERTDPPSPYPAFQTY